MRTTLDTLEPSVGLARPAARGRAVVRDGGPSVIKKIGLLVLGLWMADFAVGLLFRGLYGVSGVPKGAWEPIAIAVGFVVGAVPSVVAAWLVGRWEGLRNPQLIVTTGLAYVAGLAAGFLVVGPAVTAVLTGTNPVIVGINSAVSDYAVTALVGLFGAVVSVAAYWAVTLVSKGLAHSRSDATA
jgi:hypothetical protein